MKKPLLPIKSKVYVTVQDEIDDWKKQIEKEKLLADYKAGKKIKLGVTHTDELARSDTND